jgi:glycosyltransferase involved in cell wall biosynthesis
VNITPKIAIFAQSLDAGGAERVVANFVQGFNQRGINVHLLLAEARGSMLKEIPENVRIIDFGQAHVVSTLPQLVTYIRKEHPSIIFSFLTHSNLITLLAVRLAGTSVKTVISEHSLLSTRVKLYPNIKERLLPWLARYLYPLADLIVAVSNGIAEDLIRNVRIPVTKIKVIYNPIVTNELIRKKQAALLHPWFAPNLPPVILSVGRLTVEKDYPTLLRAFALARKKREMHLMIIGEGGQRASLEALVLKMGLKDEVRMPGFEANPYAYMAHAKLFVLSSISEGLPSALIEALACGTPVIATNCESGPAEILENGKYGKLVTVGNSEEIAAAILEKLDSSPDRNFLETRALSFSLDTVMNIYIELFDSLLGVRWSEVS